MVLLYRSIIHRSSVANRVFFFVSLCAKKQKILGKKNKPKISNANNSLLQTVNNDCVLLRDDKFYNIAINFIREAKIFSDTHNKI